MKQKRTKAVDTPHLSDYKIQTIAAEDAAYDLQFNKAVADNYELKALSGEFADASDSSPEDEQLLGFAVKLLENSASSDRQLKSARKSAESILGILASQSQLLEKELLLASKQEILQMMLPEILEEVRSKYQHYIDIGAIPACVAGRLLEISSLDFRTAFLKQTVAGNYCMDTGSVRVLADKISEEEKLNISEIIFHEVTHFLSGHIGQGRLSGKNLKVGLEFNKKVKRPSLQEGKSEVSKLEYRWLNEAITEHLAVSIKRGEDLEFGYETNTMGSYYIYREVFRLLQKYTNIPMAQFIGAYFEDLELPTVDRAGRTLARDLFAAIDESLGAGTFIKLCELVEDITDINDYDQYESFFGDVSELIQQGVSAKSQKAA